MQPEFPSNNFRGKGLIEFLSVVKAKKHEPDAEGVGQYVTSYNGVMTVREFVMKAKLLYEEFKIELLVLPLGFDYEARKAFVLNLHNYFLAVSSSLKEHRETVLVKKFPYTSTIVGLNEKDRFPVAFSSEYHPTPRDYENHKIHYIALYHTYVTEVALMELERYASHEGFLPKATLNGNGNAAQMCFDTTLSVSSLSFLFEILSEVVSSNKPVNKAELARYLSKTFKTLRSGNPSETQIYKAFYDPNERTLETVKGLIIQMLNRINSMR